MALFTRTGTEYNGTVNHDDKGRPVRLVPISCNRCHVINGQRLWIMGMENGAPYSKTGFDCWTCGNTGSLGERNERLYTAEELVRLNKAAATREAKRQAAYVHEQQRLSAERAEREAAYRAQHADFLAKIAALCTGTGSDFWDKMAADLLLAFRSPSERQIELVNTEVAKREANARSSHFGAVGDKVTLTITVERIIILQHPVFGTNYITIARCDNGNIIFYKGKTDIGNKGETLTIKATIKGHDVYNGIAQTQIQRPKVLEAA